MSSPANHSAGPVDKEPLRLVVDQADPKALPTNILPPEGGGLCGGYLLDLLGLTVMGALASRWIGLKTLDGGTVNGGLNLVVSTRNETRVLAGLAHLLETVKRSQKRRSEALSDIDREAHLKNIQQLRNQYRSYLRTERLADPGRLASFRQRIAQLENALRPLMIIERPLAGRLFLAIQRCADSALLAVYDDRSFCGLLGAARTPPGVLDLELLDKSWRGEVFDGAYLEGIQEQVMVAPKAFAIIVARPESIGRFLVSTEPVVGALADGCLIIDGSQCGNCFESNRLAYWERVTSQWLSGSPLGDGQMVGMSQQAYDLMADLRERVASALEKEAAQDVRFLGELPTVVGKLSLNFHFAESQSLTLVSKSQIERAVALAELSSSQRRFIIQTVRTASAQREFQEQCEFVRSKILALGPITARDLCRACESQKLAWLLPFLRHLVQTEQVVKLNGRFDVPEKWLRRLRVETY